DHRAASVSKLVHVELAEEHRPSAFEPADDFSILRWNSVLEHTARGGGSDTRGVNEVFQSDRNSVERALPPAALDIRLGTPRLGQRRTRGDGDESVELGVELVDPAQTSLGKLHRRDFLVAYQLRNIGERDHREI